LIFAGIGLSLAVDGQRILDEAVFPAILIMVMVTTVVNTAAAAVEFCIEKGALTNTAASESLHYLRVSENRRLNFRAVRCIYRSA
jgi:hypothetical protein